MSDFVESATPLIGCNLDALTILHELLDHARTSINTAQIWRKRVGVETRN